MFFCTSQILRRASSGPQIMRLRRSTPLRGEDDGQFFKTLPGRDEGVRLFVIADFCRTLPNESSDSEAARHVRGKMVA